MDDGTQLLKILNKFVPLIIERAFGDASLAGIPVAFDLAMPEVQDVLSGLATLVKGITATTQDDIQRLVGLAAENGWSNAELASEIAKLGEIASVTRAELVSVTESARAYSLGSVAAYKASGVVKQVEWLVGPESCDDCMALAGKVVDLDSEFAPGVTTPPYHPRCTCSLAPVVAID